MSRRPQLCQRYEPGEQRGLLRNDLSAGGYLAADDVEPDGLPRRLTSENRGVILGYTVGFGQWFFFEAIEPALAFGRAARMSHHECTGYGVFQAAIEWERCPLHRQVEQVLHVVSREISRRDDEVVHLKRFVQGVKENSWSAHWHAPTGTMKAVMNGQLMKTGSSLPL